MVPLETYVALYTGAIPHLTSYDEDGELITVFVNREAITDALLRGEELTPAQRAALDTADAALRAALPRLVERFPVLFAARDDIPTVYWRWHADQAALHA